MKLLIASTFVLFSIVCSAQRDYYLSRAGLNRRINKEFMSVAAGQTNTTLGNYASFDPTAGSFTFKGVAPIGKDSSWLSFLSLRIDGSLLGNNPEVLFTNSKLNTGTSIKLEYHLRLGKTPIQFVGSEQANLHFQIAQVNKFYEVTAAQLRKAHDSLTIVTYRIQAERVQQLAASALINADKVRREQIDTATKYSNNAQQDSLYKKAVDSVSKMEKKIIDLQTILATAEKNADSIRQVETRWHDLQNYKLGVSYQAKEQKKIELETNAPMEKLTFGWITAIAGYGKKKYYTYNATQPYPDQIKGEELGTFQRGLVYNRYSHNYNKKRAIYWNIGFLRMKDNNTTFLSTTEIKQEIGRASNDTTRTISKTYNAYTDPIVNFSQWSFFTNWTFLFTRRLSGVHVYPSVDIRDDDNTLCHLGIGYAFSFINEKKDQPVINLEAYVQFQDLFNELNLNPKFYNRNEIGVRLTLPFNFYTNKINYYGTETNK